MVPEILEAFIEYAGKSTHYQHIKPRPAEFDNWQEFKHLRHQYHKWIRESSNCPSLPLLLDFPYQDAFNEAMNASEYLVKHRGNNHPGWESMALHGQGIDKTDSHKQYPELQEIYDWTELADKCPITTQWFKDMNWPTKQFQRIRFMMLRSGGWIKPHQDLDRRELSAMNIALNNPDDCLFAMQDAGVIPWKPGDCRLIDVGRRHMVYNKSSQDRIHMIVHDHWHPDQYDIVCESYDKLLLEYPPAVDAQ